jgi:hypothetical protein
MRRRTRNGSSRHRRVEPPQDQEKRDRDNRDQQDLPPQGREYREQERERIGVDHHHVHEVHRHQELVVLELREHDQEQHADERERGGERRAAQQREPEAVQETPGEQKSRLLHQFHFGHGHDQEGGQVQRRDDDDRTNTGPGFRDRGGRPAGQKRIDRGHGLKTPVHIRGEPTFSVVARNLS